MQINQNKQNLLGKDSYTIPLFKKHICSNLCSETFEMESININGKLCSSFRSVPNKTYIDGKCEKYEQISDHEMIYIDNYDNDDWENSTNHILNPNEIVIKDNLINIIFDYPLEKEFLFSFESINNDGFTRKNIIDIIVNKYREIYKIEEETSEENYFCYSRKCNKCNYEIIKNDVFEINENDLEECLICKESYKENNVVRKLPCNHSYHKICIDKWFENEKTCPMCRADCYKIVNCGNCNDGKIILEFIGKVIPLEMRKKIGGLINRNITNGIYGIWGHDIGDLVIEKLTYIPIEKKLEMFIGS